MTAAVILDVDGTLIDSNDAHAQAWMDAFAEAGVSVSYDRVRQAIGMGGDKLLPHVAGISKETRDGERLSKRRGQIFKADYLPQIVAFPRVRDLLQRFVDDGFTLVVASSAQDDELGPLLEIAGVADLIATRASSNDAAHSKPDPDIVEAAVRRSGATPGKALMLGDTPYDVEAALRAGVDIVGVESGGWGREALHGAIEVHPGVAEILANYEQSTFARLLEPAK